MLTMLHKTQRKKKGTIIYYNDHQKSPWSSKEKKLPADQNGDMTQLQTH